MLREARRHTRGRVRLVRGGFPDAPRGPFAAVLALRSTNFAPSFAPVAALGRRCLAPGGRLVFTAAMPGSWQAVAGGQLHFNLDQAFRRFPTGGVRLAFAGVPLTAWAVSIRSILPLFQSEFELERIEPLGLLLPDPSRWRPGWRRLAAIWRALDACESHLGPLARFADHALVIVRKR